MSTPESIVICEMFPWFQRYKERGENWRDHLDDILAIVAEAGFDGWEQAYPDEAEARAVKALLDKHRLTARSQYIGGRWHEADTAAKALDNAKRSAAAGAAIGVEVVICNPEPIDWGKPLDKSDAELERQCERFAQFGGWLAKQGLQLAYHTHDAEMRNGAKELHFMLRNTDPAQVAFCLDTHWIYRGAGNSQAALDEIIAEYAGRVRALHLRQSHGGIWAETLGDGDIDHSALVAALKTHNFAGPIVAECAIEAGTPRTLSELEASRADVAWIRKTFGLAG